MKWALLTWNAVIIISTSEYPKKQKDSHKGQCSHYLIKVKKGMNEYYHSKKYSYCSGYLLKAKRKVERNLYLSWLLKITFNEH